MDNLGQYTDSGTSDQIGMTKEDSQTRAFWHAYSQVQNGTAEEKAAFMQRWGRWMAENLGYTGFEGGANEDDPPGMPPREWYEFLPFFDQMYQDKLAMWQTDRDWWMTQNQRAYDSAASQMERMVEAGLNPNLGYSQMQSHSGGKGGSGTIPKNTESLNRTISGIIKGVMTAAQIKNIGSVTTLNASKAVTEAAKHGIMSKQKAGMHLDNLLKEGTLDSKTQLAGLEAEYKKRLIEMSAAQKAKIEKETENLMYDQTFKKFQADLAAAGLTVQDPFILRMMYLDYKEGNLKEFRDKAKSYGENPVIGALKGAVRPGL